VPPRASQRADPVAVEILLLLLLLRRIGGRAGGGEEDGPADADGRRSKSRMDPPQRAADRGRERWIHDGEGLLLDP